MSPGSSRRCSLEEKGRPRVYCRETGNPHIGWRSKTQGPSQEDGVLGRDLQLPGGQVAYLPTNPEVPGAGVER